MMPGADEKGNLVRRPDRVGGACGAERSLGSSDPDMARWALSPYFHDQYVRPGNGFRDRDVSRKTDRPFSSIVPPTPANTARPPGRERKAMAL